MAPRTSPAANNSTLACDTVEAKAKPLRLGFINIALVNDSERTLNLVEPPIYPQMNNVAPKLATYSAVASRDTQ
jgi:hypothetical protein